MYYTSVQVKSSLVVSLEKQVKNSADAIQWVFRRAWEAGAESSSATGVGMPGVDVNPTEPLQKIASFWRRGRTTCENLE